MSGNNLIDYRVLTDEELILRFQKEDVKAFNEIVFRYKDRLINFLYRFTSSRESAEDISQEAFFKLYKNKHRYLEIAKFSTWFYTIAINEAKSNYRKEKKHKAVSIDNYYQEEHSDLELDSGGKTPEEIANSATEAYHIQRAINELTENHREIIILRDIEDLDYEEISKVLNIPLGTVRSRLNRAREALQISLKNLHNEKN
ncbi:MAG TPA: sigma-70 family RNA polymerase sigma factor [Ignavibacteria bacterium]|nr:sigma-70 family RNA polymerase sigma factor [Ignavibacteria bacterium]